MKRTKKIDATIDAIFTADWHLREDSPICRQDDFEKAQWRKVKEVRMLQEKYNCPVYHAGDLFHHWKPSPSLLTKCIQNLPNEFYTVYGNHDLPQHNMDLEYKSGVRTLVEARQIRLLEDGHWDHVPKIGITIKGRKIAVWHKFAYTYQKPFPGVEEKDEGHTLLDQCPQFDAIVIGDNHQQFTCKQDGRILINPGSLTRQTANQKDFEPAVWLYTADTNSVKAYYFDTNPNDISRIHIERKEERDERIGAFVERLGSDWEGSLDFTKNLKQFARENKIDHQVMEIAYKALEE